MSINPFDILKLVQIKSFLLFVDEIYSKKSFLCVDEFFPRNLIPSHDSIITRV